MRRLTILVSLAVLLLVACSGEESSLPTTTISGTEAPSTEEAPPTTEEDPGTTSDDGPVVSIETGAGEVEVKVEVADSDEERQVGLMNRESLPADAGMIFVFEDDTSGGFWMKNTLIPLSIAFADAEGTIAAILDMEPCEADPCEIYDPGVTYRYALEVNQGAFDGWGVTVGDRLTVPQQ